MEIFRIFQWVYYYNVIIVEVLQFIVRVIDLNPFRPDIFFATTIFFYKVCVIFGDFSLQIRSRGIITKKHRNKSRSDNPNQESCPPEGR